MPDIRPPAVAGMFYPANPDTLRAAIDRHMRAASPSTLHRVRAVIVPHAGYVYSGPTAAYAYRALEAQEPAPERILLMGPSHRSWFPGVAVADVDGFACPLGTQPVDRDFVTQLTEEENIFGAANAPHGPEHCLEVQIPFIHVILPDVPIVPMLFGDTDPVAVGRALARRLKDTDLLLVSSDLSHYHDNRSAHNRDKQFLEALLEGNRRGVVKGEACGQTPALALMTVADGRGWMPHLLDYRTSGDVTGETRQVVGYAAVAYTEGKPNV